MNGLLLLINAYLILFFHIYHIYHHYLTITEPCQIDTIIFLHAIIANSILHRNSMQMFKHIIVYHSEK